MIFTCLKCDNEFKIEESYLAKKESVGCPNCEAKVSPELLSSLKTILELTPKVQGQSPTGELLKDIASWEVSLDLKFK
jgi:DNA-directed RNA polymerase subunit RPC12/RpoP